MGYIGKESTALEDRMMCVVSCDSDVDYMGEETIFHVVLKEQPSQTLSHQGGGDIS